MKGAIAFGLATRDDAADIARLLRVPTGGGYALSFEREPDPFADPLPALRHAFVIARDRASGEAVGMCERVVRESWLGGRKGPVPYLGALRIAPAHRHRIAILKGGFAKLRDEVEQPDEADFALTSVAPENTAALRVLTAGLRDMPRYDPIGDYATLMMRPRPGPMPRGIALAGEADGPELDAFLATTLSRRCFAPVLAARDITWPLLLLRKGGRIAGCVGLWDQRTCRQVVVRGYPLLVQRARPLLNLIAPLAGKPALPALGQAIPQAFLSPFLLADDCDVAGFGLLLDAALAHAAGLGIGVATLGLAQGHPWRGWVLRRARPVEYCTRLFAVHWGRAHDLPPADAMAMPEAALL